MYLERRHAPNTSFSRSAERQFSQTVRIIVKPVTAARA